jgi:multicomponent Na+:H+ antiporter subunit F
MHTIVFYVAVLWMTVLLAASIVLVIRAPSILSRVLTLDMLLLILVALLVLLSDTFQVPYFLDAALVLAVLSLAATLAATRYYGEGNLFK